MNATLSVLRDPIAGDVAEVVRIFDAELTTDQPVIADLCRDIRRYRGKMLRPMLLLLSARACGRVRREHLVLAAVVEMVHMATLIHDDVLDEADLRRAAPTINRLHGNEAAVLLGDYLISHAYHLCSSLGSQDIARRIAATTNTVCEGELMQIAARGRWTLTEDEYVEIIRRKTAALTGVCCELGARLAGADDEQIDQLAAYGLNVGIAFQIVDDLLDLTATESEMGKSLGRDADLGKLTLPLIHFLHHASPDDRALVQRLLVSGRLRLADLNGQAAAMERSLEYTGAAARDYIQSAVAQLADLPPSDARDALTAAAEFVLLRRQ